MPTRKQQRIIPIVRGMNSSAAVQEVANKLKAQYPDSIDAAILNAGMMNTKMEPKQGWLGRNNSSQYFEHLPPWAPHPTAAPRH